MLPFLANSSAKDEDIADDETGKMQKLIRHEILLEWENVCFALPEEINRKMVDLKRRVARWD